MDRKLILSILGAALLAFIAIMLFPGERRDEGPPRLPWDVGVDGQGRTQIFGLTLGQSTLGDVRALFREEGEISLFRSKQGQYTVESFFEQIYLSRLRADFVLTLDAPQEALVAMYEHGLRVSQLSSGSKRIKLDPADVETLTQAPIRHITYLPQSRLPEDLLEQRFGAPAERITEAETGIVHWIFPDTGIDLARDTKGKVVIQYANPTDLPEVVQALRNQAAAVTP
jgi:hypothetical protein